MEPAREIRDERFRAGAMETRGGGGGGGEVWKRSDEFQDTLSYIKVYVAPSGKHAVKRYSL